MKRSEETAPLNSDALNETEADSQSTDGKEDSQSADGKGGRPNECGCKKTPTLQSNIKLGCIIIIAIIVFVRGIMLPNTLLNNNNDPFISSLTSMLSSFLQAGARINEFEHNNKFEHNKTK